MTRIVCAQTTPAVGDPAGNHTRALAAIGAARARGAEVIVLPELSNSGYRFTSAEEAGAAAVAPEDPRLGEWIAAAGAAVLVAGFCERTPQDTIHNSALIAEGGVVLGVYRKVHLWDRERLHFTPGSDPPAVFDTAVGRIGLLVCYDLEFPEMPRALALAGADLIAVPTNWPREPRPEGAEPGEVVIARGAARANHVFVACADRLGHERGVDWTGGTTIIHAGGWVLDAQRGVGLACADADLTQARDKRQGEMSDLFADRRPEIYESASALRRQE